MFCLCLILLVSMVDSCKPNKNQFESVSEVPEVDDNREQDELFDYFDYYSEEYYDEAPNPVENTMDSTGIKPTEEDSSSNSPDFSYNEDYYSYENYDISNLRGDTVFPDITNVSDFTKLNLHILLLQLQ